MEELVVGVGYGKKKEKPLARRKKEKKAKERGKLAVAPPYVRWSAGGYASEFWWRWWWSSWWLEWWWSKATMEREGKEKQWCNKKKLRGG